MARHGLSRADSFFVWLTAIGCAEWPPNFRASYDAAARRPRGPFPQPFTGLPRMCGCIQLLERRKKCVHVYMKITRSMAIAVLYSAGDSMALLARFLFYSCNILNGSPNRSNF